MDIKDKLDNCILKLIEEIRLIDEYDTKFSKGMSAGYKLALIRLKNLRKDEE